MTPAKKKSAKKTAKSSKTRMRRVTIRLDDTFTPDPIKLKAGDVLKIVPPAKKAVDITVAIDVGDGDNGSGGGVVIHS